jgi:hypothetical protein
VESFRSTSFIAGGLGGNISWVICSHRVLFNQYGIRFNSSESRPTFPVQTWNHDQPLRVNPHHLRLYIFLIVVEDTIFTWQDFYHHIPAKREYCMKRFEVNHLIIKAVSLRLAIDWLIGVRNGITSSPFSSIPCPMQKPPLVLVGRALKV